jgi:hypothetical protein
MLNSYDLFTSINPITLNDFEYLLAKTLKAAVSEEKLVAKGLPK